MDDLLDKAEVVTWSQNHTLEYIVFYSTSLSILEPVKDNTKLYISPSCYSKEVESHCYSKIHLQTKGTYTKAWCPQYTVSLYELFFIIYSNYQVISKYSIISVFCDAIFRSYHT